MSVSASRKTTILFSGDVDGTQEYEAAINTASPGAVTLVEVTPDDVNGTTVTLPDFGITGIEVTAVTIIKPAGNTTAIVLKANTSVSNANGLNLHLTDPDSISLASGVTSFVIYCADIVVLRLVWT
jgi:hypothetical protein